MVFPTSHWVNVALDLANATGSRLEWDRLKGEYVISLYRGADEHTKDATSLDGAAWKLVQSLRMHKDFKHFAID